MTTFLIILAVYFLGMIGTYFYFKNDIKFKPTWHMLVFWPIIALGISALLIFIWYRTKKEMK